MRASFPPFTQPAPAPVAETSPREAKLRTLKHYLYHAGLLIDELLVMEAEQPPKADGSPEDRL